MLVKGGEEVRLDHRVQQLFDAVNALLSAAADTAALRVPCVDVVPMTDRLGVLGFLPDTVPLKDAVAAHVTGQYDPVSGADVINTTYQDQCEWLASKVRYRDNSPVFPPSKNIDPCVIFPCTTSTPTDQDPQPARAVFACVYALVRGWHPHDSHSPTHPAGAHVSC